MVDFAGALRVRPTGGGRRTEVRLTEASAGMGAGENKIWGFETFRVKMLYICVNSLSTKHYNRREK
jgi:hypothetical protein